MQRSIERHGAVRWFVVLGAGLAIAWGLEHALGLDLGRGSWHRYAVFGGLAVVGATVLALWSRVSPRHRPGDAAADRSGQNASA